MIPISAVRIGTAEEALVLDVLRSGQLAQGPMVARLESDFAERTQVRHAIAVNNGTTALVAALEAAGIGPGDEVITTPFTFVATLNAILEVGASVRFADIGPDFTIDPVSVAARITPRTAAVIPVHLFGLAADMAAICTLARRHGLAVIEDAAQAHGATVAGRAAGSFGIGCFSLYATKNITGGEGGLVTTNDDAIADRLRLLRNQGMRARYMYEAIGHNYRMTDLQAAVVLPQLARLDDLNAARRRNARRLCAGLSGLTGITLPEFDDDREHVWHQFTIRVGAEAAFTREKLAVRLAELGVGSGIYYPKLVHDYDCYRQDERVQVEPTPVAEQAAREVLSLPVHPGLSEADVGAVVSAMRDLLG